MKKNISLILFLALVANVSTSHAQSFESGKDGMKKIAIMTGHWSGEAKRKNPDRTIMVLQQTEEVKFMLDSTIVVVNGKGVKDGKTVFEAFGVISYDAKSDEYRFDTYLNDGKGVHASAKWISENVLEWGFSVPGGQIKYIVNLTETTWKEDGEFSPDGVSWYPFLNMNLTKTQK